MPSYDRKINMVCPGCGYALDCTCSDCSKRDEDGHKWHLSCYRSHHKTCPKCYESVRTSDLVTVYTERYYNDRICSSCAQKYAHKCGDCGRMVYDDRPCPYGCDRRERFFIRVG